MSARTRRARADVRADVRLRGLAPARPPADRASRLARRGASEFEQHVATLLDLLDELGVSATFFVAGITADRHPAALVEVVARGHEVGCHGYEHRRAFRQTPEEFRRDVVRCVDAVERICGVTPVGYRAPWFSITRTRSGRTTSCGTSASATTRASTTRRASHGGSSRSLRVPTASAATPMRSGSFRSPSGDGAGSCSRWAAARTGAPCRASCSGAGLESLGRRTTLPRPLLPPVRVRARARCVCVLPAAGEPTGAASRDVETRLQERPPRPDPAAAARGRRAVPARALPRRPRRGPR